MMSLRNPWFTASVGVTLLVAVAASLVGFILLPSLQGGLPPGGLWYRICSAAGVIRAAPSEVVVQPGYPTTRVVLTSRVLHGVDAASIGRGATLALRCAMCHGARGLSNANTPNLAGQYAIVIYKQLADFQSGARASAVMAPLVHDLSDQDMRDLAAYYAYLPRLHAVRGSGPAPRIVVSGAPMRNIPPCGACHGELAEKVGTPWLEDQPVAYLQAQLRDFASSTRRNDIDEQMRNIARNMTPAEIVEAAQFYGTHP